MGNTHTKPKNRDENIRKAFTDELNLNTKVVKSKKDYKRKPKYPNNFN